MGKSLAHRWGQIVGEAFESAFHSVLSDVALSTGVYMDSGANSRPTRNGGVLKWQDERGNWHRLDYVFERGGTDHTVGAPVAFVELAWRRYTKHSKNKAQEIEGAVIPLAETFRHNHPFLGAILGGVFTNNSVQQLRSRGFSLIYVRLDKVTAAFATVGIDAANDEDTDEKAYATKIAAWQSLSSTKRDAVLRALVESEPAQVREFVEELRNSLTRLVERVIILPLHGESRVAQSVDEAIEYVSNYADGGGTSFAVIRYEIEVRYSNGAQVRGSFPTKSEAIAFLRAQ